ncbi:uncharacterized protein LOC111789606 [Cucurbita pepo subsp. pepo]|uniref:uncharacterized protein LOC111789606 n=1 Tax=Cucurbita pepo subsp. pepo TaxID=3664 RepID=UPI000C9D7B0F|nr:uncharacterized protein LOC111789606 [Cucurbita pepo subsp. pepo]
MAEHQKRPVGHGLEVVDDSRHEKALLRAFDQNGVSRNSSKDGPSWRVEPCEVEKISRRLSLLEEDTRAMKKALFESLEERRNLVYEINQQFQSISKHHQLCNEVAEDHDETLQLPEEWRSGVGLSQIFHHQPNISLVFKHFKPNLLAFTDYLPTEK